MQIFGIVDKRFASLYFRIIFKMIKKTKKNLKYLFGLATKVRRFSFINQFKKLAHGSKPEVNLLIKNHLVTTTFALFSQLVFSLKLFPSIPSVKLKKVSESRMQLYLQF